jgi:hypothetical protein
MHREIEQEIVEDDVKSLEATGIASNPSKTEAANTVSL